MKRHFIIWVLGCLLVLNVGTASASNYPPEFHHQRVYVIHNGPLLFARVGNGYMTRHVIGYKKSGYLFNLNSYYPDSIDAVVTSQCYTASGYYEVLQTVIRMGREWHDTGYMSMPLDIYHHISSSCILGGYWRLRVAFSDGRGHWDSRYGQDYVIKSDSFTARDAKPAFFDTRQSPANTYDINLPAWNFIVDQMLE